MKYSNLFKACGVLFVWMYLLSIHSAKANSENDERPDFERSSDAINKKFVEQAKSIEDYADSKDCARVLTAYREYANLMNTVATRPEAELPLQYNALISSRRGVFDCIAATTPNLDLLLLSYYASLSVSGQYNIADGIASVSTVKVQKLIDALKLSGRARDAMHVSAFEEVVRPKHRELLRKIRDKARASGDGEQRRLDMLSMGLQANDIVATALRKQGITLYEDIYAARAERYEVAIDDGLDQLARQRGDATFDFGQVFAVTNAITSSVQNLAAAARPGRGTPINSTSASQQQAINQLMQMTTSMLLNLPTQTAGTDEPIGNSISLLLQAYLDAYK